MTGWDVLSDIMNNLPPIAAMLFLLAAGIIFAIGFSRHGLNFIKYGFKQTVLGSSLEKRFDKLEVKIEAIEANFYKLEAKIEAIELNHFGHLKNYLGILNGVLLDQHIIDNETKARLDNELRGM
ncbi:MAG: hypothetical protein LBH20_02225 [Treponema sp.]|jgi:hypothetical protein|nr:hypothetical protein [Treponema sp.]